MEQPFELTVQFNNKEKRLAAKLVTMGYTYKIFVDVEGTEVIFEPDEERHLRAVIEPAHTGTVPAREYIMAIGETLEKSLLD